MAAVSKKGNDKDTDDIKVEVKSNLDTDDIKNDGKKDMKILFLDVDGVLNQSIILEDNVMDLDEDSGLSIIHLKRLKTIIDETDCYIVLSTTWRLFKASKAKLFNAMKLDQVGINVKQRYIGDTPKCDFTSDRCRVMEIKQWLDEYNKINNVIKWVAVDDMELDEHQDCKLYLKGHFVMTQGHKGMSEKDMNQIIALFNAK